MSLFEKCYRFDRPAKAQALGLMPYFHAISASHGATEVTMEGRRVLMIGSNNYLGLTCHPKVQEAAHRAIREFGTGCSGSRFLNGTLEMHHELERRLAAFFRMEACLVFSTGFQTNLGVLGTLPGRDDIIFCDRENHASIYDGVRLSFAKVKKYRHNDMDDLERLLAEAPDEAGKLIVTDGIFSMLGDIVDLARMRQLADQYGAKILVDDAHGVGVIGEHGRGTMEHCGVDVELLTGTFSKSFASLGGFFCGPRAVVDYVKFHSRPLVFSAAMTPANAATVIAALDVVETEPEHRERLLELVAYMRNGFKEIGYEIRESPSAIIPVVIGEDDNTLVAWRRLFDLGVFTNAVIPPAVPAGQSMLRTSYMATHTKEQLDRCLGVFARLRQEASLAP